MKRGNEFKAVFLPSFYADVFKINTLYLTYGSKNGAVRIKNSIMKATERIQMLPFSGKVIDDDELAEKGFRIAVIEKKYLLIYKICKEDDSILFMNVINGKVDYPLILRSIYSDWDE